MKVINLANVPGEEAAQPIFVGKVKRQPLVTDQMAQHLRLAAVTFSPGARTKLHTHTNDQVLFVTAGKGILATGRGWATRRISRWNQQRGVPFLRNCHHLTT